MELVKEREEEERVEVGEKSIVRENSEIEDGREDYIIEEDSFIDSAGNVVVMCNGDEDETGKFEIAYIDIQKIVVTDRIRKGKNVEDLVRSIKTTGLINPIVVAPLATDNMYVLIKGYRRMLACARVGIKNVPCLINKKISTKEISVVEALYSHSKPYTMKEIIEYISYLEGTHGLTKPSMIEYLLQLDNGDYAKLKDVLEDNDEDIVTKLYEGEYSIEQAFKALEKRRKKETREEKDARKSAKAYDDTGEESSGVEMLSNKGVTAEEDDVELTEKDVEDLTLNVANLDEEVEGESLKDMIDEGKQMEGFKPHQQDYKNREHIDKDVKKAVLQRDGYKCVCCDFGGPGMDSLLDCHHIKGVYAGDAKDDESECATVCLTCHQGIHDWSFGTLKLTNIEEMTEEHQKQMKKIIKFGNIIREGMLRKGVKIEEAKKNREQIRRKPGTEQTVG